MASAHTRSSVIRQVLAFVVLLLIASACQATAAVDLVDSAVADDNTIPTATAIPPTPTTAVPDVVEAPTAPPEPPTATPTAAPTTAPVPPASDDFLVAAFAKLREVSGYRVSVSAAQNLQSSLLGSTNQVLDTSKPNTIFDVAPNGDTHTIIDLGPIFEPLAANAPEVLAILDDFTIEMWSTDQQLVIDTQKYQRLLDIEPSAELGPFRPGLFTVDLSEVAGDATAELTEAIAGAAPPNPISLGESLPRALEGIAADPNDPNRFTATATFSELTTAMGSDIETVARSAASGVALGSGLDVDQLTAAYVEFYNQTDTEIEIWLDDEGGLAAIQASTDLSSIFDFILGPDSPIMADVTDAELQEAREAFADISWQITTHTAFETNNDIVVTPPTGVTEDRTAEVLAFVEANF